MNISITGSRSINDYNWFHLQLSTIINEYSDITFISGGAKGIDSLIKKYCIDNNIILKEILPEWEKFGRGAGVVRNKEIIEESDLNIIFWDGESKGSKFNIDYCRKNNKKYILVNFKK
jgi:hypothetical protein